MQLLPHRLDAVLLHHLILNDNHAAVRRRSLTKRRLSESATHLLVLGDRVEQLDVQFGVVLGQRLVSVMVDQLHHRAEGQGVGEAVLPLPMEDLYQLVVASFPAGDERTESW